jgi:hypothetical protein
MIPVAVNGRLQPRTIVRGFAAVAIGSLVAASMASIAAASDAPGAPPAAQPLQVAPPGNMTGQWLATGQDPSKDKYAVTVVFSDNGAVKLNWAASGKKAAGVVRCKGNYQYDGQSLALQFSACASCVGGQCRAYPAGTRMMSGTGPVQFQDQGFTFHWHDLIYRRQ